MTRHFDVKGTGSRMNVAGNNNSVNPFTRAGNRRDDVRPASGRSYNNRRTGQQGYPSFGDYPAPYSQN